MKILVCEYFTAEGHANLFVNVCKLLKNSGSEVVAVVPNDFEKDLSFCKVEKMKLRYYTHEYPKRRSTLKKIFYCLHSQKYINSIYKKYEVSATFVVTFDEIALAIGRFVGYIKDNTFVIHNLNPDNIYSIKYRRFAFNIIKNKVYNVVLAGYIKHFLVNELHTDPTRVLVFPHPMTQLENRIVTDIDCVGISNSNDENIIEEIINSEISRELIKKNNLKVLLKSRNHRYDNGYLKIISGFIDSDLYDDYIARAKCILIPFPETFRFRVSGTLIDALSNNKSVIGTNIHVITQASNSYKNVIKIFNISSFVNDIIEVGKNSSLMEQDFSNFQKDHGEDILSEILNNAIERGIKNQPMEDIYDF